MPMGLLLFTTIGPKRMPARKKRKKRLTVLSCANMDGREKIALLVVGPTQKPRCFFGRIGRDYGIYFLPTKRYR